MNGLSKQYRLSKFYAMYVHIPNIQENTIRALAKAEREGQEEAGWGRNNK